MSFSITNKSLILVMSAIFLLFIGYKWHKSHYILNLPNQYKWILIKDNDSVVKDYRGETIVGPGCITLLMHDKWIYGYVVQNAKAITFVIDTEANKKLSKDEEVSFFLGKISPIPSQSWNTFYDMRNFRKNKRVSIFRIDKYTTDE